MLYGVFVSLSYQKYVMSTIECFRSCKSGVKSGDEHAFSHRDLLKYVFESLLFGLFCIVIFYFLFNEEILEYFNHYIAFSSLYLLSRLGRGVNHFFLVAMDLVNNLKQFESAH